MIETELKLQVPDGFTLPPLTQVGAIRPGAPATKRFVRAGIVVRVNGIGSLFAGEGVYLDCDVIEGNSSLTGTLGGGHVVRLRRRISLDAGDRVVRWIALGARAATPAANVAGRSYMDRAA